MFKQKTEAEEKLEAEKEAKKAEEEVKAEQEKNKEEPNPNDVDFNAKFEYKDINFEEIETSRLKLEKFFKKLNWVKLAVAILAIGLLVFAFIFIMGQLNMQGLGFGVAGISIVLVIAYYIIIKRVNNKKMTGYLKEYYGKQNAYVFGEKIFSDVNGDIGGKIDNAEFADSLIYKDISTFTSRNIVNFKIDGKIECKICDCGAQKTTVKKLEPLFIGKYLIAENKYEGDDPIFVYLTGNSRSLPPNNLDGYPKVMNTKKMIIYTNNSKYASVLNAKVRELLANIITNNILVDFSMAITKGKTYFCLGYDDCLMVLPLKTKFHPAPTERFKTDLLILAEMIRNLN